MTSHAEASAAMTVPPRPALRRIEDLPGPRGLPVVGSAFQVKRSNIHRDVEAWAREYGPCFRLRLGANHMLVITDHETVAGVLRDRPDGFRRTPRTEIIANEMGLIGPGVFSAEGETWRAQRRMVMASFAPQHVKAYFPSLVKVAGRLQGRWQKAARSGATIELQADLMRFTVDAIAGLAFGADINTLESDEDVIQRHLDKIFPALFRRLFALVPYWHYVRLPADRELERSVVAIKTAVRDFIAQARARLGADPDLRERPGNLLEAMIVAADEEGSGVGDQDVAGNVLTMLLAGEDTTANTLAWMVHLLYEHPDALQRAQQEVRSRLAGHALPTLAQLDSLDYLEACAHETMRLKPVAPFMVFQSLRDTVVADILVPARTMVWCVMRSDSVSERHFPHADRFEPERWLDGPAHEPGAAKRVAMPFGAGPRVCPGRFLALLEIKMAMALLLNRFDIAHVGTADGQPPAEHMSFAMGPMGLQMRLRERA
jgi:cytochrome P450